jgi:hypothetical protein
MLPPQGMTCVAFEETFLADHDPRTWHAPPGAPKSVAPTIFFLGQGNHPLEVALATSHGRPKADDVRALWRARQGRRPSPLLLIVAHSDSTDSRVTVCGPVAGGPPCAHDLTPPALPELLRFRDQECSNFVIANK